MSALLMLPPRPQQHDEEHDRAEQWCTAVNPEGEARVGPREEARGDGKPDENYNDTVVGEKEHT